MTRGELEARQGGVWGLVRKRRCVAHALVSTREATVVHVYNTARISKRVHLYREKPRLLGQSVPSLPRKWASGAMHSRTNMVAPRLVA
jgi:hypothetical protein